MTNLRHIHVHTPYSLLDGFCKIDQLVQKVKDLGMDSVAITDHGTMHGTVDFYKQCKKSGINPIIGLEVYVVPDMTEHERVKLQIAEHKKRRKKMTSREKTEDNEPLSLKDAMNIKAENDETYFGNSVVERKIIESEDEDEENTEEILYKFKPSHLLLLAKNNIGYKNLMKIATESQLRGFYYKPRVDKETLEKYSEGIIATSACRAGEIPRLILRGRVDLAEELALEYSAIFDSFYLELQPSENIDQLVINETLQEVSKKTGVPMVATSDAHYINLEDSDKHEILLSVSTGSTMSDEDRFRFDEHINYIMTEEEMLSYKMPQSAIDNTKKITDMCKVELEMDKVYLPDMPKPEGYTPRQFIEKLCIDGLYERYNSWEKKRQEDTDIAEYIERIRYELDVIEDKGFIDYFLIVMDFVNYAKDNDILVGPGRGSAAGCMVSYTLGITNLDPIKYDLIFERFLNPERTAMPDIDIDFEEYIEVPELFESGRQRVIDYVIDRYGKDKICQILAMGTIAARSALKDVGRALEINHLEINQITKFVPNDSGAQWSLRDCVYGNEKSERKPVEEIAEYAQKHPRLFATAIDFEGIPRHTSIHAAGVVIAPIDVKEVLPLARGGDDAVVAQFDKDLVEELGLIKMDFLGLRTLGVMHRAVNLIKERHGIDLDLEKIDLEDSSSMKIIKEGDTDGIFQIESNGMKNIFRQMNTVDFEAIIVALSLYRPGPMAFIPQYVACKNGYSEPEYLFPQLEPILNNTYGIIVYQEQVMRIATDLAGFTMGQADKFRKAVGKKDIKLIEEQIYLLINGSDEKNIPGLLKNGISLTKAQELGEIIVEFAKYAFNRSHSAGYAVLTSQTAYLKANYYLEFMIPLISSYIGKNSKDKITQYLTAVRKKGYEILAPDVNKSSFEFTIEDEGVRYGIGAIKGLNKSAVLIIQEREENGEFKDLEDFLSRFSKRSINKKSIDVLALCGALNSLSKSETRHDVLKETYEIRGYKYSRDIEEKYIEESDLKIDAAKQMYDKTVIDNMMSKMDQMRLEQSLLGSYISGHPLDDIADPINWDMEMAPNNMIDFIGIIKRVNRIKTKNGNDMAFATVEVLEGERDVVIFPSDYDKNKNKLEEGGIRDFTVKCERRRDQPDEMSLIAKNIKYYRGE